MNYRILSKLTGLLLLPAALAMAACALFAVLNSDPANEPAETALFLSAIITFFMASLLIALGVRKITHIPRREGLVVVAFTWILASIFGALPFLLCGPPLPFSAAIFESTSGFTTTGATAINNLSEWPSAIILWRSVMHWLGGIGILVLFTAVLAHLGIGTKSLFSNESSMRLGDTNATRIRDTTKSMILVYLGLSAVCMIGLKLLGLPWFDAVNYTFSAVATGGFTPTDGGVSDFANWTNHSLIEIWLSIFMFLGNLSFILFVLIIHRKWQAVRRKTEMIWCISLWLIVALSIAIGLHLNGQYTDSFGDALRHSWFTVVSLGSTTGFSVNDFGVWPTWCRALLALLMLIGGCSGSTAGGMKIDRLIVFLKSTAQELVKAYRPNQVFRLMVNGTLLDDSTRARTVSFVALYLFLVALGSVTIGIMEAGQGIDLETCLGAVLAGISNVGVGFGSVGPSLDFSTLRGITQVFMAGLMVLGRLELFTILVLFTPSLWKHY